MSLLEHAKFELAKAKFSTSEDEWDRLVAEAVLELIQKFSEQGHSGASASSTLAIFNILATYKTLTPISNDPNEWMDISEYMGKPDIWQNRRDSSLFSKDGGETYYDVNDDTRTTQQSEKICIRLN